MKLKQSPDEWKEVELGKLGDIVTGYTPPKNNPENYGNKTPWIKPPNLDNSMYVSESNEYLSDRGTQTARLLPTGSVMVSCIGNIGKIAISGCSVATNQQINSIIPNQDISPEFLYYDIKKHQKRFESASTNAVVPLLNKTRFSHIKIPLPFLNGKPDLKVQNRIVSILEQAEKLKQKRQESDKLTNEYLKSVFNEMFLNQDFESIEIAKGILKTENKDPKKSFPKDYFEYVDIASIDNTTKKIITTQKILGEDAPSRARQLIKSGDILVSTVRPNLNAVAITPNELDNQICSTGYCILRSDNKNFVPDYLFFICQNNFFINHLVGMTKGANYPAVGDKDIKNFKIPLPPLPLQNKFSSIVSKVENLKERQKLSSEEINNLFDVLIQKAFKGELK